MTNKVFVFFLVLVAIVGVESANAPAPSTSDQTSAAPSGASGASAAPSGASAAPSGASAAPSGAAATAADGPDAVGTVDGGDSTPDVVAGPIGSPSTLPPAAESPKAGAATLKVSAVVGASAVAGYFFF